MTRSFAFIGLVAALLFVGGHAAVAQVLPTYSNGLIYDTGTVRTLRTIVASLNTTFERCSLDRSYHALPQTIGTYYAFSISPKDSTGRAKLSRVMEKMSAAASPEAAFAECPEFTADEQHDVLVVLSPGYEWEERGYVDGVDFYMPLLANGSSREIFIPDLSLLAAPPAAGEWVVDTVSTHHDGRLYVKAIHFDSRFTARVIPEEHARLIQYADCMIDTTTADVMIAEKVAQEDIVASLLTAIAPAFGVERFERFVERNVSVGMAMEMKRRREVVGFCSMDDRPIVHAQEVATLAARSARWDVFLRAHLNIMNDRFDRMSDGSYAWERRYTYIGELEELNIDVHTLLFGISFALIDPSTNHYQGSIGRLGRALAETRNPSAFEERVRVMIADERLDLYNRFRLFCLYTNYLYSLPDPTESRRRIADLRANADAFPAFLRDAIRSLYEQN